ncbi:MAG: hypothetical protein P4M02_11420 [Clostridia bacterium]|nr:hypothetical protein [Clostridia bacterium]
MKREIIAASAAAALLLSSGCSGYRTRMPTAYSQPSGGFTMAAPSQRVVQVKSMSTAAEDLYSAVDSGNWAAAQGIALRLGVNTGSAPVMSGMTTGSRSALVGRLQQAINAKDNYTAKKCANQLYRDLSNMAAPYNSTMPTSLNSLKYYCRETQLACQQKNKSLATANISKVIGCWNSTRAVVSPKYSNDVAKGQRLVNTLNRCIATGNLTKVNGYCGNLLAQTKVIESDCAKQNMM